MFFRSESRKSPAGKWASDPTCQEQCVQRLRPRVCFRPPKQTFAVQSPGAESKELPQTARKLAFFLLASPRGTRAGVHLRTRHKAESNQRQFEGIESRNRVAPDEVPCASPALVLTKPFRTTIRLRWLFIWRNPLIGRSGDPSSPHPLPGRIDFLRIGGCSQIQDQPA